MQSILNPLESKQSIQKSHRKSHVREFPFMQDMLPVPVLNSQGNPESLENQRNVFNTSEETILYSKSLIFPVKRYDVQKMVAAHSSIPQRVLSSACLVVVPSDNNPLDNSQQCRSDLVCVQQFLVQLSVSYTGLLMTDDVDL